MDERCGLESCGSREEPMAGSCEHDDKSLGSMKGKGFIHHLFVL